MATAASGAVAAASALDGLMRNDRGRLLSALIARLGSFQIAEEALQDAIVSAVGHWGRNGVPTAPHGWLLRTAYHKAIDRYRQSQSERRKINALLPLLGPEADGDADEIPDERLRLILTCCHPAIEPKSRICLTLRSVCGLSTREIAAVFLDAETTMGQRLSRTKAKIAAAGIPFAIPDAAEWSQRLESVLSVIYLVFTSGYVGQASSRRDLAEEAIFLARLVNRLRPDDAEIEGCLALLLLTHARNAARQDREGTAVPLDRQDRALWKSDLQEQGLALLDTAMNRRLPGPYQIKAAIAACHMEPGGPDWPQILLLYDSLLRFEPSSVVSLNRAVALAEIAGPKRALEALWILRGELVEYQPFHAVEADLLARQGRSGEALAAYERAMAMTENAGDRALLLARANRLRADESGPAP